MQVIPLTLEQVEDFIKYCTVYGKEHDESYLPNNSFEPNSDNPTYILIDKHNEIRGAVSLILEPKFCNSKKGRFRILHSIKPSYTNYKLMVEKIFNHTDGLDDIYLFIPEEKKAERKILEKLGFKVQRYSWYLERLSSDAKEAKFPKKFKIKPLEWGKNERIWCDIINSCFENHQGHINLDVSEVKNIKNKKNCIEGGMLILWKDNEPIGTVQVNIDTGDENEIAYISWLSIKKKYRGLELGKNLLRTAVKVAYDSNVKKVGLVVHSSNEKAVNLYLKEGFKKVEVMVCYNKKLN